MRETESLVYNPIQLQATNNVSLVSLLSLGFGSLAGPNIARYSGWLDAYVGWPKSVIENIASLVFWFISKYG